MPDNIASTNEGLSFWVYIVIGVAGLLFVLLVVIVVVVVVSKSRNSNEFNIAPQDNNSTVI
jgi:uncharacterized membrane protein YhaH (DUF805 family)